MKQLQSAFRDLKRATSQYKVWSHLGWVEVKQRYRRTVLGPWWITLSMLLFIVMMGIVFSRLFHQSLDEYMPFFTVGFLFWSFISACIIEAVELFKSNGAFITQINLPFNLYLFKHLIRHLIFLGHNAVVYVLICAFFKINPGLNVLLIVPGLLLFVVNVYWICLLIAIICARFRDMGPIINSCVQIAFFVTPISWMPRLLDQNPAILKYNPLVYLLDVVRAPLLGTAPSSSSYLVVSLMAVIGLLFTFVVFTLKRSRIAFWVD